jgi:hypothetical protein
MEYTDFVDLLSDKDLASEIRGFRTLENVLNWLKLRNIDLGVIDMVTQDEYTHDLLIPLESNGRFVVFGMT